MSTPNRLQRAALNTAQLRSIAHGSSRRALSTHPIRRLATVQQHGTKHLPETFWFKGSDVNLLPSGYQAESGGRPPDERTVKLGKTLRILQERLPTLLQYPLPAEILSPQITLHLFPSTHPHLPAVSGRVAYNAALWTSPLAWGRVPIVGNVKLEILSERMIKNNGGTLSSPSPGGPSGGTGYRTEKLVVRWQTCGKTKGKGVGAGYKGIGASEQVDKITEFLGGGKGEDDSKEFTGLFIFEFDEEGRILSHTIEHVQESGSWERGVGARVVGLTDWLLGGLRGKGEPGVGGACPAIWAEQRRRWHWIWRHRE